MRESSEMNPFALSRNKLILHKWAFTFLWTIKEPPDETMRKLRHVQSLEKIKLCVSLLLRLLFNKMTIKSEKGSFFRSTIKTLMFSQFTKASQD